MGPTQAAQGLNDPQGVLDKQQFLSFLLAGEEYGIDILRVQEIRGWKPVTPIPSAPPFIKGVMNLRGAIVPAVDLRLRFGMQTVEYSPTTVVVVVHAKDENQDRTVGIVVDAVSEVYEVGADEIKPPPDFGNVISVEFMQGIATVDGKMILLLDINGLVSRSILDFARNGDSKDEC